MKKNVAINGFGRIGRLVYRIASESNQFNIVAINDLVPIDQLAYLLKYDTVHRPFSKSIKVETDHLVVDGQKIAVFSERNPENLPWDSLGIDCVVESTGIMTHRQDAEKHLSAGAKRVVLSAPAKDEVPTYVYGVNHHLFHPEKDLVVSNASCTTNCLAPIAKVLLDSFGIEEGLMTTVHAMTASQPSVDAPAKKDFRSGRAAAFNIIPASTGAAKAVTLCLPELKGKLTGMAFRVPVLDVSVVDLTVKLERPTSFEEISAAMKQAAENELRGVLCYCDEPVVSSDFIGSQYSSIFDRTAGIALNDRFYKLIAWYDNETGYAARIVDLITYLFSTETER